MPRKSLPAVDAPAETHAEGSRVSKKEQALLAELRIDATQVLAASGLPVDYNFESFVELVKIGAVQMANASLLLGSALLAIRANEPVERYRWVLEQIGMGEDSARMAMSLARQVSKSGAHRKLHDAVGASKALAMFRHYDDAEIAAIAADDAVLDEYAGKSVRQLAADLKKVKDEASADLAAKDAVLARKDAKISKLQEQLERRAQRGAADGVREQIDALLVDASAAKIELHAALKALLQAAQNIRETQQNSGDPLDEAQAEAIDFFTESTRDWLTAAANELAGA